MNTDPPSSPHALPYQIAALVVLVLLAAFFAASEAALVSISRLRARAIAERRVRGSRTLEQVVDDKTRYLTSILVGNTIVLLAADSLTTYIFLSLGIPSGAVLSTVLMAAIFLLFGEIVPKTVATGDSERWALRLALPMRYASYVLTPIARAFQVVTNLILAMFGIKNAHSPYVTEEDIRTLVNVGAEQRVIEEQERELIHSVMEFGDTIVREVMKPRPEMVAVAIEDSPRRALDVVIAEGYSKLPVYQESKDDIVGVVHAKDILAALRDQPGSTLRGIMRAPLFVPGTREVEDVLADMKRLKVHLAVVLDEYGGTAGLVTMEDLLEEIVGPIYDEYDRPAAAPALDARLIDGGMPITQFNTENDAELDDSDYTTIGGYVFGKLGRLPRPGDRVEVPPFTFEVAAMEGRRVKAVRLLAREEIKK